MIRPGLIKRVSKYAFASTAVLSGAVSSKAEITYHPEEITGTGPTNGFILSFNLAGDVDTNAPVDQVQFDFRNSAKEDTAGPLPYTNVTATAYNAARLDLNPWSAGTMIGFGETVNPGLQGGELDGQGYVKSESSFVPGDTGPWSPGQRAYLALMFDTGTGSTNYGWADITVNDLFSVTLHSFAYEDTGGSIAAGAVPEPSQVALFALGAAGLAGYRMRRRAKIQ